MQFAPYQFLRKKKLFSENRESGQWGAWRPHLCPLVMVTFSWGRGMDATLEAVNILVSESCRARMEEVHVELKQEPVLH